MPNNVVLKIAAILVSVMAAAASPASSHDIRSCWLDSRTGVAASLVPPESRVDPTDPDHRIRPVLRYDDGDIYPGADFVRGPGGVWFDAVTGRTADSFPENSSPDERNPDRRLDYVEAADGHDVAVAEYRRAPCPTARVRAASDANASSDEVKRLADDVLSEINAARTDPIGYAAKLKGSSDPDVREAVEFLRRQSPLSPLALQVALLASASRHAVDQGRSGSASHRGTDGSTVRDRVNAAGGRASLVGEEIAFDADTGMGVARQLIVDHGVPDRGHRAVMFNATLTSAGVACNPHTTYRLICVIDVSGPSGR